MNNKRYLSSNLSAIRESADILLDLNKYENAYSLYDEANRQVWLSIGNIQNNISSFTQSILESDYKTTFEFQNKYTLRASETAFMRNFELSSNELIDEFIQINYGKLQSLLMSNKLIKEIEPAAVLADFHLINTLVLNRTSADWVSFVLKIYNPIMEGNRVKSMFLRISDKYLKVRLAEDAEMMKRTDFSEINAFLLDYLIKSNIKDDIFLEMIKSIVGRYSSYSKKSQKRSSSKSDQNYNRQYQKYEKYEKYEKFESYENFESNYSKQKNDFEFDNVSETEKSKFFGDLFGLKGQVTKAEIRKKYFELIAKYHPDKVAGLGTELIEVAENKSKQINQAYEWFKRKYQM